MKLIKTEAPNIFYKKTRWQKIFDEFMEMNTKYVKLSVDFEDSYSSLASAYSSCHKAILVWKVPVRIVKKKNELYLIRTDMEETEDGES